MYGFVDTMFLSVSGAGLCQGSGITFYSETIQRVRVVDTVFVSVMGSGLCQGSGTTFVSETIRRVWDR